MKLCLFLTTALLICTNSILFSQSSWIQQSSGTSKMLITCFFINEQTGFAGGYKGALLKTTNGGNYWLHIFNDTNYDVCAIYFIQNNGWALIKGNSGNDSCFILKTFDFGNNWIKYFTDTNIIVQELADMQFININTGFISKLNCFLKSTNGGINFSVNRSENFSSGLYFINSETGWVGGYAKIFHTTNGGNTWINQLLSWPHQYAVDIHFLNNLTGFCISKSFGYSGPIFYTSNTGINWIIRNDLLLYGFIGIQFLDLNTGYILANNSSLDFIAKTSNQGLNWDFYEFNSDYTLYKMYFANSNTGWVVGDSGTILKTTTGGIPIGIQQIGSNVPVDYFLYQNYPNPFNPVTKIRFDIAGRSESQIFLAVYDLLGREIAVLVNQYLKPAIYEVDFNAYNIPSGVYYYKLTAGDYSETKKMILVK